MLFFHHFWAIFALFRAEGNFFFVGPIFSHFWISARFPFYTRRPDSQHLQAPRCSLLHVSYAEVRPREIWDKQTNTRMSETHISHDTNTLKIADVGPLHTCSNTIGKPAQAKMTRSVIIHRPYKYKTPPNPKIHPAIPQSPLKNPKISGTKKQPKE